MESKAGSILLLISGILTILISLIVLVLFLFIRPSSDLFGFSLGIFIFFFILILIIGGLKLWASKLMKNPETTTKGGIIALIVGILSAGDLLAIIGGILGIVQGGK